MTFEARLEWRADESGIACVDRLILGDAALQADGRWLRAGARAAGAGEAELDAAPWIVPAGLAEVVLDPARIRVRAPLLPGRFYPRLAFAGLAQGARDLRPARVLAVDGENTRLDPNHPLAGRAARLLLRPSGQEAAPGARMVELFDGPGIQNPPPDPAAAFFRLAGFERQDETPDAAFYAAPRLVHHLDAACRAEITRLYGRFLTPGARVLDLMTSWTSHLPAEPADLHVAGLGLNRAELAANPRLSEQVVKDLNARPELPWRDAQFDLAICSASIEYLTRPRAVVAEARRVLKPGGVFVVTFSDRWFPPKAIALWSELHPFERLGFVLALLRGAGFVDLHGETLRGLKRPEDDKYAAQRAHADPLFAAWGRAPG